GLASFLAAGEARRSRAASRCVMGGRAYSLPGCPNQGPPATDGAMRTLYVLHGCPFAFRTEIALREKGLPYERVVIGRANKPAEVLAVSPSGATPVLYDEGGVRLRE